MRELEEDEQYVFKLAYNIFSNGIVKEWLYVLAYGKTKVFGSIGIMNTMKTDGVMYLNSGTRDNLPFTLEMWKEMLRIIKSNEKLVIQSTLSGKFPRIQKRYGFRYNSANNSFERGL